MWHPKRYERPMSDVRRVPPFKSFCRKCSCHHPLETEITGKLKGCICNPTGRRGECGRYIPTDSLEYLEYLAVMKDEEEENNAA
jgi:hypothetical protein